MFQSCDLTTSVLISREQCAAAAKGRHSDYQDYQLQVYFFPPPKLTLLSKKCLHIWEVIFIFQTCLRARNTIIHLNWCCMHTKGSSDPGFGALSEGCFWASELPLWAVPLV